MATQILDTELAICRKYLHFSQRALFEFRFGYRYDSYAVLSALKDVKYWRARYNAAMAIEQEREESNA